MADAADTPRGVRTIATSDGDVSYVVAGAGPGVLAIQGVGVMGRGWRPQVDRLSTAFRFITFDNRGIGANTRGDGPLTIERMAGDALAIVDAEGIDRVHVVGHSMGGLVAQHLALTRRERVKSLALLCTFADGARATRLSGRMLVLALQSRIGTPAMRRHGMVRMVMPDAYIRQHDRAALARDLGDLFGRDLADQPPIVLEQLRAMSGYSALARLNELSGIPTLVVSARHDPIASPVLGKDVASRIPGARYVEFADASHALPIQFADEVNALLADHWWAAERSPALESPAIAVI